MSSIDSRVASVSKLPTMADDILDRLYKTTDRLATSRPSTSKSYNTKKAQKQARAEAAQSAAGLQHATRLGLPPRTATAPSAISHLLPRKSRPPTTQKLHRAHTPDARDPQELAAQHAQSRRASQQAAVAAMRSVDPSDPVVEEEQMVPYDNPQQNPFNFIQAVQEGTADFLEFVYLIPRVCGHGEVNPYNLQIVSIDKLDRKDYFTLGISGVTHFRNGAAEFTPLDPWRREFRLHSKIQRIPFFKKYRAWKNYFVWRKRVRCVTSNNDIMSRA